MAICDEAKNEPKNGTDDCVSNAHKEKARLFPSSRMTVTIMMFLGCVITYILRLNLGFAMVCMIKSNSIHVKSANISDMEFHDGKLLNTSYNTTNENHILSEDCQGISITSGSNETEDGEFEWPKSLQGVLLGAFFYGYIITQVPAGWLADRFGGKRVLGLGLGIVSALTLVLPEAARFSPYAMLAVRIVQGMFAAVSFPAMHSVISSWGPPTELGQLMGITYSGIYVGTLVTYPLSAVLCQFGFAGGWPSVFYVNGMMGIAFVIGLIFLVYDGYENHPRISLKERNYLQSTLIGHHQTGTSITTPWKKLVQSGPVWGIVIAHVCGNWGLYTLTISLPLFMKEVLKFDIQQNGLLSCLPNLSTFIAILICGKLSDYLTRRAFFSLTTQRKLITCIGMFIPAACMLAITFLHCQQRYVAVAVLVVSQTTSGFAYSGGYFCNHVDLSPQHAGILMGVTNTFATIPGILSPLLVGLLTPNGTRKEWLTIFYISCAAYAFGGVVYLLLGSGERQSWSFTEHELEQQKALHRNPKVPLEDANGRNESCGDQM